MAVALHAHEVSELNIYTNYALRGIFVLGASATNLLAFTTRYMADIRQYEQIRNRDGTLTAAYMRAHRVMNPTRDTKNF